MARYHINPKTGDPALCRAKIKCPFGNFESDHYDSKESARTAYEERQDALIRVREEFSQEMTDVVSSLEVSHGEYYLPRGVYSHINRHVQFEYFTRNFIKNRFEEIASSSTSLSEEFVSVYSRDSLRDVENPDVEDPEFWAAHFDRVTQKLSAHTASGKTHPIPDNCDIHGPAGAVGSPKVAESLVSVLKELEEDDIYEVQELGEDSNTLTEYADLQLEASGFEYLGQGVEQVSFVHSETGVVWKIPFGRWRGEGSKEVMKNAMIGQETFPKSVGLRHAKTSGYVRDGITVVAQERVDGNQLELSREQHALLNLAGHSDTGEGNHGTDEDGTIVAFDTLGTVWEDLDEYELSGVTEV